jgi:hypothetical protein
MSQSPKHPPIQIRTQIRGNFGLLFFLAACLIVAQVCEVIGQVVAHEPCVYDLVYGEDDSIDTKCEEYSSYTPDYVIGGPGLTSINISTLPDPLPGEYILLTVDLIIDEDRAISDKSFIIPNRALGKG